MIDCHSPFQTNELTYNKVFRLLRVIIKNFSQGRIPLFCFFIKENPHVAWDNVRTPAMIFPSRMSIFSRQGRRDTAATTATATSPGMMDNVRSVATTLFKQRQSIDSVLGLKNRGRINQNRSMLSLSDVQSKSPGRIDLGELDDHDDHNRQEAQKLVSDMTEFGLRTRRRKECRISPPVPPRPLKPLFHRTLLEEEQYSVKRLGDVDKDKRGNAFSRIQPDGWLKVLPKKWVEDEFSSSSSSDDDDDDNVIVRGGIDRQRMASQSQSQSTYSQDEIPSNLNAGNDELLVSATAQKCEVCRCRLQNDDSDYDDENHADNNFDNNDVVVGVVEQDLLRPAPLRLRLRQRQGSPGSDVAFEDHRVVKEQNEGGLEDHDFTSFATSHILSSRANLSCTPERGRVDNRSERDEDSVLDDDIDELLDLYLYSCEGESHTCGQTRRSMNGERPSKASGLGSNVDEQIPTMQSPRCNKGLLNSTRSPTAVVTFLDEEGQTWI